MSNDDENAAPSRALENATTPRVPRPSRSISRVPPSLKRVFDQFPLRTYEANELPQRALVERKEHVLHVFTTPDEARKGRPSFNPGCLKWQAYLRFSGLRFQVVPSSNHASPTGMLPFLQPGGSDPSSSILVDPAGGNKLRKWVASQKDAQKLDDTADMRYEAYASLLDNRIRKAWLLQLYLTPQNSALAHRLYVSPCSRQPLVQMAIARQLRSAAEAELVKPAATNTISALDLIREAGEAFRALSVLLGSEDWFFGQRQPGLFDASVFAYTHLILATDLQWKYNPLAEALSEYPNLAQHRERTLEAYF